MAKKVLHLSLSLALHIGCIYMTIYQQFCKPWPISYNDWKGSWAQLLTRNNPVIIRNYRHTQFPEFSTQAFICWREPESLFLSFLLPSGYYLCLASALCAPGQVLFILWDQGSKTLFAPKFQNLIYLQDNQAPICLDNIFCLPKNSLCFIVLIYPLPIRD